jgi:hypothetical protein
MWKSELNERYNTNFFRPRSAVEYGHNTYIPRTSIFYSLIIAITKLYGFDFFVPLLGVLGVAYLIFIARDLFESYNIPIVGGMLLAVYPPYLTYSNSYFDIIPSLVFWLISIRYYQKFIQIGAMKNLVLSIIMFSVSIGIRPPMAIFVIFFISITLLNYKKFLGLRNIGLSSIIIFLSFLIYFGMNNVLLGSFFGSGRLLIGSGEVENKIFSNLINVFKVIDPFAYSTAFKNYVLPYSILLFLGLLGTFLAYKKEDDKKKKNFIISLLFLALFLFFIFGGNSTLTGFNKAHVRGSLSRLFLPIGIIMILYTSYFIFEGIPGLKKSKLKKISKVFFAVSIVISHFSILLTGPSSFSTVLTKTNKVNEWQKFVKTTPENSIIIGKANTIYAVLDRPILLIYDNHDFEENPNLIKFYPIMYIEDNLLTFIKQLRKDGYVIFLTTNSFRAKEVLLKNGYKLKKTSQSDFLELVESKYY